MKRRECADHFHGRLNHENCADCGHVLAAHDINFVCSICDAIEQLRREMRDE